MKSDKLRTTVVLALSLLLPATGFAQHSGLEAAFDEFANTKSSSVKVLRSNSRSMTNDEQWKWRRYEFTMSPTSRNMKLLQTVVDAYYEECSLSDVDFSYLSELQPGQSASEWTVFSIPYSKNEKPFVIGGEPTFSLLVVRKNRKEPELNVIYAMEWRQDSKDKVLQVTSSKGGDVTLRQTVNPKRSVIHGNIFIVETAGELAKVNSQADGLADRQYPSDNLRRLSFYCDKFMDDPIHGGAISAGCLLIARDIVASGNIADVEAAKTVIHTMLSSMHEPYRYEATYSLYNDNYTKLTQAIEILNGVSVRSRQAVAAAVSDSIASLDSFTTVKSETEKATPLSDMTPEQRQRFERIVSQAAQSDSQNADEKSRVGQLLKNAKTNMQGNFEIIGSKEPAIGDVGYRISRSDSDLQFQSSLFDVVKVVDNGFSYKCQLEEICLGRIRAILKDGTVSTQWIEIPFVPGEIAELRVQDGSYTISGSDFYKQWYQTSIQTFSNEGSVVNYAKKHINEPGCLVYIFLKRPCNVSMPYLRGLYTQFPIYNTIQKTAAGRLMKRLTEGSNSTAIIH